MMPMRSGPVRFLAQKARAGLGLALDLEAACVEKQILCPAERGTVEPAVHFPDQLDRITGTHSTFGVTNEIAKITRREIEHTETAAFLFKDARLYAGSVFAGRYRHYLKAPKSPLGGGFRQFRSAALVSSAAGLEFFGHWLADDMPRCDLAAEGQEKICLPVGDWKDFEIYCRLLDREFLEVENAFFDELTIFKDLSQNSLRRKRYDILRQRLRARIEPDGGSDIVYFSRGRTGVDRIIENESELIEALQRQGIRNISLEHDSTESILAALHGARIVITVEGSHQKHCLFSMPDKAAFLLIQPPTRFMLLMKGFADCLGWPFGFVIGEDRGEAFHVYSDEVLEMIDELQKRP
jgi:hypothetical protein